MKKTLLLPLLLLLLVTPPPSALAVRIKDITTVEGVRDNQLIGYGLVVGLNNTGDDRAPGFTIDSLAAFMRKNGINLEPSQIDVKNCAAVAVTATLPPFAKQGMRMDVVVSSLGNSTNLAGGTLIATLLRPVGANPNEPNNVYAVAQGTISTGGYAISGQNASQVKNHPNVAFIPNGGLIEREVKTAFASKPEIQMLLRNPDFTTAVRVAQIINSTLGQDTAKARDATSVSVKMPAGAEDRVTYLSQIESLEVSPDSPARVVYNERTGTIVMGSNVRISTAIITHGNLVFEKKENKSESLTQNMNKNIVSTLKATNESTDLKVTEEKMPFRTIQEGVTIGEVARGLNALGVSSRDIISILQALKECGALQAELVAM